MAYSRRRSHRVVDSAFSRRKRERYAAATSAWLTKLAPSSSPYYVVPFGVSGSACEFACQREGGVLLSTMAS